MTSGLSFPTRSIIKPDGKKNKNGDNSKENFTEKIMKMIAKKSRKEIESEISGMDVTAEEQKDLEELECLILMELEDEE